MATIRDIAAHCGVSIGTVSKALNGYGDVSAETRSRIRQAAQTLGYRPNAQARALKTHRSFNLGVLFADSSRWGLTHAFFATILQGFKEGAEARGYDITFISGNLGQSGASYLEHCRQRGVDGLCVTDVDIERPAVQALFEAELPVVLVDREQAGMPCVLSDNAQGMGALVRYAAAMGHRDIAYIHGRRNSQIHRRRFHGFESQMRDLGLPLRPAWMREAIYYDAEATGAQMQALLSLPQRPTCVLLPDDYSAMGALRVIWQHGLRVPEDLSIAGFDGQQLAKVVTPRLTTVEQAALAMGREAAGLLVRIVSGEQPREEVRVTLPGWLIEGETVGALR